MRTLLVLLILSACAPAQRTTSSQSVSIAYDAPRDEERVRELAEQTCAAFGQRAGDEVSDIAISPTYAAAGTRGRRVSTWTCVDPS